MVGVIDDGITVRTAYNIGPGLDHIANFINSLDTEGMTVNEVRSAIYAECINGSSTSETEKAKGYNEAIADVIRWLHIGNPTSIELACAQGIQKTFGNKYKVTT